MARKIPFTALITFTVMLFCSPSDFSVAAEASSDILVSYSFDDGEIAPNPNTYMIWQNGRGRVQSSTRYRFSGYHSLEISDSANDHDFPELQGYFPEQKSGTVFLRFALFVATPLETFNIALAGRNGFALKKDGIAFWLSSQNGFLYHTTDSIPSKLFKLKEFTWYIINVTYSIDRGAYDLQIAEEKQSAFINLKDQPNASASPGSSLNKISFIGDKGEDTSNVEYYVDDVLLGLKSNIVSAPLAASVPRRSYFIDAWYELKRNSTQGCPALLEPSDIDLQGSDWDELKRLGQVDAFRNLMSRKENPALPKGLSAQLSDRWSALAEWYKGCAAAAKKDYVAALMYFDAALVKVPRGKLYELSKLLALGGLERWTDVDDLVEVIYRQWFDDPRFDLLFAELGLKKKDLKVSAQMLTKFSKGLQQDLKIPAIQAVWNGDISSEIRSELKAKYPTRWKEILLQPLIAEQYFYVLLWQQQNKEAHEFAASIQEQLTKAGQSAAFWTMLCGDALFYLSRTQEAAHYYESAVQAKIPKLLYSLYGRLSDAYYVLGDLKKERTYREAMYKASQK